MYKLYLDTSIYLKLLVYEPDTSFYAELIDQQEGVCSSELIMTEAYSALLRKEREKSISPSHRAEALEQMNQDFREGAIQLIKLDNEIFQIANQILEICSPKIALRSLDALHLASYQMCKPHTLWTSDIKMRCAAEQLKFALSPLPS